MPHALVVDDNKMNLSALEQLLKREGIDVTTAETPNAVPDLLAAHNFNVVFLDLEFPNHNGIDYIADLKAEPTLVGVPIIAYTVHISEQNEARMAGFDGFLGKPLNVSAFPEQLRRILAGEAVWDVS